MIKMKSEKDLRKWLREAWVRPDCGGGELCWVEAAHGGTDGAPDVFIPLPTGWWCGLELKYWPMLQFKARPAQARFHRFAAEAKIRTAFLVLNREERVFLVSGEKVIVRPRPFWNVAKSRLSIQSVLMGNGFWKGNVQ